MVWSVLKPAIFVEVFELLTKFLNNVYDVSLITLFQVILISFVAIPFIFNIAGSEGGGTHVVFETAIE